MGDSVPAGPVECHIRETGLTLEHIAAFRNDGVLILRGLLDPAELAEAGKAVTELVDWSWTTDLGQDVIWTDAPDQPGAKPIRIEYVVDKSPALQVLAGHPLLLEAARALVGPALIPTWDSLVYKTTAGAPRLAWHRDGEMYEDAVAVTGGGRVIDVGIYFDDAPQDNCVWAIPGSNYWPPEKAAKTMEELNASEWDSTGAVPAIMRPGDVLIHNILTLHAAPAVGPGAQRRVVYFEYRPAEVELLLGPHNRDYAGLKQQVLLECLKRRAAHLPQERPFEYSPAEELRLWSEHAPITHFRYPHEQYWTWERYS